jgi:hypothetical protein
MKSSISVLTTTIDALVQAIGWSPEFVKIGLAEKLLQDP